VAAQMSPKKRPAHELAGQRIYATGALDDGYRIPDSGGPINAKDRNGKLVRLFHAPKKMSLAEVTAKLEEHIRKHSGAGSPFTHPILRPTMPRTMPVTRVS